MVCNKPVGRRSLALFSWVSVAVLGVLCLVMSRLMLQKWQEDILFSEGIIGILLGVYSASLSAIFSDRAQLLAIWIIACTLVALAPVLWWMPFIGEEKAEAIAIQCVKSRGTLGDPTNAEIMSAHLDRWNYHFQGSYGSDFGQWGFEVVISAKRGNVVTFDETA